MTLPLITKAQSYGLRLEAADNVSSPENCEQVAAWPRRKTSDFRAFPSSRFGGLDGANAAKRGFVISLAAANVAVLNGWLL